MIFKSCLHIVLFCLPDCVEVDSPEADPEEATLLPVPEYVQYVGPWHVGNEGIPNSITIDVHPELTGEGDDVFIWLTDKPQNYEIDKNYGIRK